jgi:hypothetical protein
MMKVDVENAFKNLSQVAIFRELCDVGEHSSLYQVVLWC